MGNILQFKPVSKKQSTNRVEALVKGQVRTFTCDVCGGYFEALFDNLPDKCPNCGREIDWGNSNVRSEADN